MIRKLIQHYQSKQIRHRIQSIEEYFALSKEEQFKEDKKNEKEIQMLYGCFFGLYFLGIFVIILFPE